MLARTPLQPSFFKRVLDAVMPRPPAARPFQEMGTGGTSIYGGFIQTRPNQGWDSPSSSLV